MIARHYLQLLLPLLLSGLLSITVVLANEAAVEEIEYDLPVDPDAPEQNRLPVAAPPENSLPESPGMAAAEVTVDSVLEQDFPILEVPAPGLSRRPDTERVDADKQLQAESSAVREAELQAQPFRLLNEEVLPGTLRRLSWYPSESSAGLAEATPVLVANGAKPGQTLCITAAIHGDELNGIEIVRNLLYDLNPDRLQGTIIGVPIVNLYGFRQGSRYLSDRRDLNRYFPGNPSGSFAARIAYSFFNSIIRRCDYLVDLQTGSFQRTNLPQLRADLNKEEILHMSKGFGATVVLHGAGPEGSLRGAATQIGIPAVVIEAGEPLRVQPEEVAHGVKALRSLLNYLGMVSRFSLWGEPQPVFYESYWVRAESDGILTSNIKLGQNIRVDDLLGRVTDPITNVRTEIRSPYSGRVIGMALNQSMRPGYAAYHIGIRKSEDELAQELKTGTLDEIANNDESLHEQERPESENPAHTDTDMDIIDTDRDEHSIMDPPLHDALLEAAPLDNQAGE
ncbi:MAG: succinylglutamate desuccinylase/aspartoacylase family protein [Gammaproteobacteria bacterium]